MDAITLLTGDHNRVRGLFKRFTAADDVGDTTTAGRLAAEILTELEVHTAIEEEIFYPACREGGDEELTDDVAEGLEEHHVVDRLMAEIKELTPGDEAWSAKLKVLIENVEHHAEEEEQEMFPAARAALGDDEMEELARRLDGRKEELGAPTLAEKVDLTREELIDLAAAQEIPGRSAMSKEELAATVAPA